MHRVIAPFFHTLSSSLLSTVLSARKEKKKCVLSLSTPNISPSLRADGLFVRSPPLTRTFQVFSDQECRVPVDVSTVEAVRGVFVLFVLPFSNDPCRRRQRSHYLAILPNSPSTLSTSSSFICVLSGADVDRWFFFAFHIVPMTNVIVENQPANSMNDIDP